MSNWKAKVSRADWKRPSRARVKRVRDRLREMYGRPVNLPHRQPVDELVRTILSQATSDSNRDRAFAGLKARFDDWESVRDAPEEAVEAAIRPGGLSRQKAPRIQAVLKEIENLDLGWLEHADRVEAMEFLTGLPGVGRKTAACVQVFTWNRPEIPVDVHVFRIGGRLGLFRPNASFDEAHDEVLALVDPEDSYEFHMNLIRHGRTLCRPNPVCGKCSLMRMCPYGRGPGSGR
ncbi:MAG TPA: endonuclease III [Solirubrobacterales bacterium]|nr:endonuclease III [Solirubrobacterales bacterium]